MNILFICKWNRFRSKFAEAYFKKINRNKRIKVKSVGLIEVNVPLRPGEKLRNKYIKKNFGLVLSTKSKGINVKTLEWADKIFIVADDVPKDILFSHWRWKDKFTVWDIEDEPLGTNNKKINASIIDQIFLVNTD